MGRFKFVILILIIVFAVFLLDSYLKQTLLLKKFSSRNLAKLWEMSQLKHFSVTIPDYVFNYSQKIKSPLECIPFTTIQGEIPICVHYNSHEVITNYIRKKKIWEREHCKSLQDILVANPDYGVIDIGANLGMFSLLAANLQRRTLAIEAMDINIERFHQSIVVNRFEKYITLVTRPLSDKHEKLQFAAKLYNLGQSAIVESRQGEKPFNKNVYKEKIKSTVLLDELIDLVPLKKAIMVIDVEGNEGKVFRGGQKFFDAVHVNYVFMEWFHLSPADQKFTEEFFINRGYEAYDSPFFKRKLNLSTVKRLTENVFWQKTKQLF